MRCQPAQVPDLVFSNFDLLAMSFHTPLVLLIFNRPRHTARVLAEIARLRPSKLLVIADGPRVGRTDDLKNVAATRAMIDKIPWPCELLKNYSDTNFGCRQRIGNGLNWVFREVERAIVLEDDCLPTPSFFTFCEQLLDRYHDDERVMSIAGTNFQNGTSRTPSSYYFSKYFHCWGWATWRRAWQHFDIEMKTWPVFKAQGGMRMVADSSKEQSYWTNIFDRVHAGQIDSWAYAFMCACFSQGGLQALPDVNLVSNIGFDTNATHTSHQEHHLANLPLREIAELRHPSFLVRQKEADAYTFRHAYCGGRQRGLAKLYSSLRKRFRPKDRLKDRGTHREARPADPSSSTQTRAA